MSLRVLLMMIVIVNLSSARIVKAQSSRVAPTRAAAERALQLTDDAARAPRSLFARNGWESLKVTGNGVRTPAVVQSSVPVSYGQVLARSPEPDQIRPLSSSSSQRQLVGPTPECSQPPSNPEMPVEYRAYIPVDHESAPPSIGCAAIGQTSAVYEGDLPYGYSVPPTYRVSVYSVVEPGNSLEPFYGAAADTGITFQFAPQTPVNGSYLSTPDYDGIFNDCYVENEEGRAQFGGSNWWSIGDTVPSNRETTVTYNGAVADPLIPSFPPFTVGFDVSTSIYHSPNAQYVNVTVSGDVTCYPAHEVLVAGHQMALVLPTSNSPGYIAACLIGPDDTPLVGGGDVAF
jgi:hypothetical protein